MGLDWTGWQEVVMGVFSFIAGVVAKWLHGRKS